MYLLARPNPEPRHETIITRLRLAASHSAELRNACRRGQRLVSYRAPVHRPDRRLTEYRPSQVRSPVRAPERSWDSC